MNRFGDLCARAERNGLSVEVCKDDEGRLGVWVFPNEPPRKIKVEGTAATLRVAVVASPFADLPPEAHADQLDRMLEQRGYR